MFLLFSNENTRNYDKIRSIVNRRKSLIFYPKSWFCQFTVEIYFTKRIDLAKLDIGHSSGCLGLPISDNPHSAENLLSHCVIDANSWFIVSFINWSMVILHRIWMIFLCVIKTILARVLTQQVWLWEKLKRRKMSIYFRIA